MIRYFIAHPTAANLLMVSIILVGLLALPKLQRDTFPVIPATEVEVRVSYPGASAVDVEEGICQRIEEVVDVIADLKEVRCDARENIAITVAQMRSGADMGEFYNDLKSAVDAIDSFPEKAETPTITEMERTATVASIAITGEMATADLWAYAEQIRGRIQQDRRIAQVRLQGFSEQEIAIELSKYALQRHNLTISDITTAISQQSVDLPAGTMETQQNNLLIRFADQRRTPAEFANLVVLAGEGGGEVRLGDIATIDYRFEVAEDKVLFNGQRAALLEISKTTSQDALRVMDAIKEHLTQEQQRAPRGVQLEISQDVTSNITDRLRILKDNGLMGLILVFLSMWAFFSLRYAFWVTMGLPVSFLGAIFVMDLLGYTINMITMVALLVAIGLLMDDAIIISENIATKVRKGYDATKAALHGTQQVLPGVLSSFLTTIMVVGPLAFLAGRMGEVLKYMPAVLVITLAVSLLEAFLILPHHLRNSLAHMGDKRRSRFHHWFENAFESFRDHTFGRMVDLTTHHAYFTVGLMILALLVSIATIPAGMSKFRAFPELESDVIQARILLPQGTPLARTEEVVDRLVTALEQVDAEFSPRQPDGQSMVRNVLVLFNTNVDAFESGPHVATISADLLRAEARNGTIDELLNRWRSLTGEIPDVIALKFTDRERGVAGKAIDIRLSGANLDRVKQASLELQQWLRSFKGVQDLSDDLRPGKPEIRITLKDGATALGINARTIANEVRAALRGESGMEVLQKQEAYDIAVRLNAADRDELNDLRYLRIRAKSGELIPLSAIATLKHERDFARIHRVNGRRTVTIQGKIDTKVINAQELMAITKQEFLPQLKKSYPDVKPSFQGQGKESAETGNSLLTNILIGLFGVYVILSFQFRSYLQPIAVMLAIPMGFIGVIWGHMAMGLQLSMVSLVGFATLAGIVVNDSILLVAFIKERMSEGMEVMAAAKSGARDRFRAIVLTTLTTIAGLLPLLMETSTQAQLLIPMVTSLVFGLFAATMLSVLLIPAFFVILDDWGKMRIDEHDDQAAEQTQ